MFVNVTVYFYVCYKIMKKILILNRGKVLFNCLFYNLAPLEKLRILPDYYFYYCFYFHTVFD